jgi:2',3'-cyclic-nucleotide 2'-phosphodiesterase (5'-nucleotidase family)
MIVTVQASRRANAGLLLVIVAFGLLSSALAASFPVKFIHINDNHGRFEPADYFSTCSNPALCFGGFAKQQSMANILRVGAKAAQKDFLFLHAGDEVSQSRLLISNLTLNCWNSKH